MAGHLYNDWPIKISEIIIRPEDPYGHHWSVECRIKNFASYFCPTCLTEFEFLEVDLAKGHPICGYCGTALLEEDLHAA